jgi:hypothetical protein
MRAIGVRSLHAARAEGKAERALRISVGNLGSESSPACLRLVFFRFNRFMSIGFQGPANDSSALPTHQLRDLNEIAAGVIQHGDLRGGHVFWWHSELGAARFHAFVIALRVVGEEHGRGLTLLK